MKNHDVIFANRPTVTAAKRIFYGCRSIAFSPYGEYWRKIRKICVLELLSFRRVQSFQFIREEEINQLVNRIRSSSSKGSSVNLSEMLLYITSSIVSRAAFGRKYVGGDSKNDFGEITKKISEHMLAFSFGDFYPYMGWMDSLTGFKAKLTNTFRILDDFLDRVIDAHRVLDVAAVNMSNRKDLVDVIFDLQRNGTLDINLSEDSIKAILLDMYFAGTDTASTTMEWAIAELIRNPIAMKKAQEEVRRVVGNKEKVEEKDILKMEYLQCVIKETLRLHPPGPLLLPRESSEHVKVGDYDIPPKTRLLINVWAIQRDPTVWEKPEEFLPERFKDNPIDFKGQDFEFIPFGTGRRGCPGMTFGLTVVEYTVASLLYWFNWELPGGGRGEDLDMSEAYGISVHKEINLHLLPKLYSNNGPRIIQE